MPIRPDLTRLSGESSRDSGQVHLRDGTYLRVTMEKRAILTIENVENLEGKGANREIDGSAAPLEPGPEFIVWWDEPEHEDLKNPRNWSSSRKWLNICVISVISFLV